MHPSNPRTRSHTSQTTFRGGQWGGFFMADQTSVKSQAGTDANPSEKTSESSGAPKSPGRRRFIAGLGAATAAASTGVLAPLVAASSARASDIPDLVTQS